MISERAQGSFDRIFRQSARARLPANDGDACDIVPATLPARDADAAGVVVLTISSMAFRLLMLLQFADDDATRRHYRAGSGERTLSEALMEIGNLCCGSMNQQLVEYFPDLGMSTPYVLGSGCLRHLDELKPDYVASYQVTVADGVRIGATLCVCADAPVDFYADATEAVAESVGELELF